MQTTSDPTETEDHGVEGSRTPRSDRQTLTKRETGGNKPSNPGSGAWLGSGPLTRSQTRSGNGSSQANASCEGMNAPLRQAEILSYLWCHVSRRPPRRPQELEGRLIEQGRPGSKRGWADCCAPGYHVGAASVLDEGTSSADGRLLQLHCSYVKCCPS